MNHLKTALIILSLLVTGVAVATPSSIVIQNCEARADSMGLKGDARLKFLRECEADVPM